MNRAILLLLCVTAFGTLAFTARATPTPSAPPVLAPVPAVGVRLDTALIGGYTGGRFVDAVQALDSELSDDERRMIGDHLDRIFADRLDSDGLGGTGRLRVAYERAVRPDGTTRSIRVLGAEVAAAGRVHTAFSFEHEGRPVYVDPAGAPIGESTWAGPLERLRISSPFAERRMHPILRRILPHTGVDYAAPAGEPVRATADGMVVSAGPRGGYGLMVELRHPNGYDTRYAHLSRIGPAVRPARLVRRGEIVGYVGMTGLATGPHLHYEVRRRGQPVDPVRVGSDVAGSGLPDLDRRWVAERQELAALLARTPTVLAVAPERAD